MEKIEKASTKSGTQKTMVWKNVGKKKVKVTRKVAVEKKVEKSAVVNDKKVKTGKILTKEFTIETATWVEKRENKLLYNKNKSTIVKQPVTCMLSMKLAVTGDDGNPLSNMKKFDTKKECEYISEYTSTPICRRLYTRQNYS